MHGGPVSVRRWFTNWRCRGERSGERKRDRERERERNAGPLVRFEGESSEGEKGWHRGQEFGIGGIGSIGSIGSMGGMGGRWELMAPRQECWWAELERFQQAKGEEWPEVVDEGCSW